MLAALLSASSAKEAVADHRRGDRRRPHYGKRGCRDCGRLRRCAGTARAGRPARACRCRSRGAVMSYGAKHPLVLKSLQATPAALKGKELTAVEFARSMADCTRSVRDSVRGQRASTVSFQARPVGSPHQEPGRTHCLLGSPRRRAGSAAGRWAMSKAAEMRMLRDERCNPVEIATALNLPVKRVQRFRRQTLNRSSTAAVTGPARSPAHFVAGAGSRWAAW